MYPCSEVKLVKFIEVMYLCKILQCLVCIINLFLNTYKYIFVQNKCKINCHGINFEYSRKNELFLIVSQTRVENCNQFFSVNWDDNNGIRVTLWI